MIELKADQQSPEWFKARLGIPTASNFDKIITTKGEPSKQAQKYMYQLAAERISGVREETYQNQAMLRGIEMEAEARSLYELAKDCKVEPCGLGFCDERKLFAASPDGLVGKDGCIEIKCPNAATHVAYLLDGTLPSDYFQQTQGQLLVTGRKWNDFISYFPGLRPMIVRCKRDDNFIAALQLALESFCKQLDEITERIR
jgi:putative phage-type endonuclease